MILLNKFKFPIILIVLTALIIFFIYREGKKSGANSAERFIFDPANLPNAGSDIPTNWTPINAVRTLHEAMDGIGTNEEQIWAALNDKTPGQLVAIYNTYAATYQENLFDAFEGDLSDEDLARALNYFNGLIN